MVLYNKNLRLNVLSENDLPVIITQLLPTSKTVALIIHVFVQHTSQGNTNVICMFDIFLILSQIPVGQHPNTIEQLMMNNSSQGTLLGRDWGGLHTHNTHRITDLWEPC